MEVSPKDRRTMDALAGVINNTSLPESVRAEAREDFGGIAMGYLDLFLTDEEREEYEREVAARDARAATGSNSS